MLRRSCHGVGLLLLATAFVAPLRAQTPDLAILYHERLEALTVADGRVRPLALGEERSPVLSLSFVAFGRQFDVELRPNSRLTSSLAPELLAKLDRIDVYEGELRDVARSWVRLTRHRGEWSGVISDGVEIYAIESYTQAAPYLVGPADAASGTPVIYRWKDAVGRLIDTVAPMNVAAAARASAQTSSVATSPLAAISPAVQIDVGFVGDFPFSQHPVMRGEESLISIANVADGIFVSQVGVHLNIAQLEVFSSSTDPFTSSNPGTLLGQLGAHKAATPALASLGLVHLLTGRSFDTPRVIGFATVGSLCDASESVSITNVAAVGLAGFVVAHEIGHNFGAPHDGEAGSACASAVGDYVMNPIYSGAETFSTCSLLQMQPVIANAGCIYTLPANDVSLHGVPGSTQSRFGEYFEFEFTIDSRGADDAFAIALSFAGNNATVAYSDVYLQLGAERAARCKYQSVPAQCSIHYLHDGESVRVRARATTDRVGPASIQVTVASANDPNPLNDTYRLDFDVVPTVDLEIDSIEANPPYMRPFGSTDVTIDFSNHGSITATAVEAHLNLSNNSTIVSMTGPTGACREEFSPSAWLCPVGTLEPHASRRVTARILEGSGAPFGTVTVFSSLSAAEPELNGSSTYTNVNVVSVVPDLSLDITASPQSPTDGERMQVTAHVRNVGTDTADDVSLHFDVNDSGFVVDRIESGAASCPVMAGDYFQCVFAGALSCGVYTRSRVECVGGSVPSGSDFELRFSGIAHAPGGTIESRVYGADDPDYRNDSASIALTVGLPAPPPATTPSSQPAATSGGGGGSIGWWSVAMLALALVATWTSLEQDSGGPLTRLKSGWQRGKAHA